MNDKLSICITVKNRSKVDSEFGVLNLLPNCLRSIQEAINPSANVEIIISDWESTDWPLLEWIGDIITDIPVEIINVKTSDNNFSAGKGRNIAASRASGDILLFLDADMLISKNEFYKAWDIAKLNGLCYPIVMYQKDYNSSEATVHEGGGILFISKTLFYRVDQWPEYDGHGFEDTDMATALKKITTLVTAPVTFYHQWHPQDKAWKNRYAKPSPIIEQRRQHYKTESEKHLENWFGSNLNEVMTNTNFPKRRG